MSIFKKLLIIILSAILVACIGINVWYLYVYMYGEDKVISNTFEVGLQTLEDESETRYFIEINYMSNDDRNGIELFEIKFNYMLDENQTAYYSQGLQYVDSASNMYFNRYTAISKHSSSKNFWGWESTYWDYKNVTVANPSTTTSYNYMSGDDYEYTELSSNPIGENTYFKIQLGDNLYLMKLKGTIETTSDYEKVGNGWWYTDYAKKYEVYDINYLSGVIFNSIKSLKNGVSSAMIWEFGDLFDYYEFDESSGTYTQKVNLDKAKSIIEDTKSYYSIFVNKSSAGATKAEDSIFNCISGNSGYRVSKNVEMKDYFLGRTIIKATNVDFITVNIVDDKFALKLSDSFIEGYSYCSDKVALDILITTDEFSEGSWLGFTADSGLSRFYIRSCRSVNNSTGSPVYTVVEV